MHMRSMCNEASIYIKFRIIVTLIKWNQRDYKKGFLKKKYKKKKEGNLISSILTTTKLGLTLRN